jgi:hypothetical protein
MAAARRQPGVLTRLLRAYSSGLRAAGYPDTYSGVTGEIADDPLDHSAGFYDPDVDHNQLRLSHSPRPRPLLRRG